MAYRTNEERLLASLEKSARIGECGGKLINDTAAHTGPFVAITALSDTDTAAATIDASDTTSNITDLDVDTVIPQGMTIFGTFSEIKLTGGTVIAYKKCNQ